MRFIAEINIMPLKALLDPQGKAVFNSMKNLGFTQVQNVRIGKHIMMELDAQNRDEAAAKVEEACSRILSNPIIETYEYTVRKD